MANLGDTGGNQDRNEDAPAQDMDCTWDNDFSSLNNSLQQGNILGNMQLTQDNFWIWSRRMRIALGGLGKFGFVDGTIREPDVGSESHDRWQGVDAMVTLLILNTMSEDVARDFRYIKSARDLWNKIEEMYGRVDSFVVYQSHRDIRDLRQGEMNVNDYFSKFKKLWNHLHIFVREKSVPDCTCAAGKPCSEWNNTSEVMQFLIGLNPHFDGIRNQILAMEPLPCISKAFNLVWTFETMNGGRMNSQPRGSRK